MRNLAPCPFCGIANVELQQEAGTNWWYVLCCEDGCLAAGPIDLGASGATAKWNERAQPPIVTVPILGALEASKRIPQPTARTATPNQTYTWLCGDSWAQYTAATDGEVTP